MPLKRKGRLALGEVYRLLEPGPVVLISTLLGKKPDIMTQSWHTMMEFEPPLVGLIVSERNLSYEALVRSRECAINIPTAELSAAVVGCGNVSGRSVDKFARFALTPEPASMVRAPLIRECFASLECRVVDQRWARRYGLFVVKVLAAWVRPAGKSPRTLHHRGRGLFMVAGESVRLPSRMR